METDDIEAGRLKTRPDSTKDKKFHQSDPDTKSFAQHICYGQRLIKLQMLMGENNVLKKTPLSIAIDNFDSHELL